MDQIWDGVPERIERLRRAYRNWHRTVFGADGHGFRLLPALTEAEVAEAESQFGAVLPREYRTFLTAVSQGGAGPYYGLFPLVRDSSGRWGWHGDGAELTDLVALHVDFRPGDVSEELVRLRNDERAGDIDLAPSRVADGTILGFGAWYLTWLADIESIMIEV